MQSSRLRVYVFGCQMNEKLHQHGLQERLLPGSFRDVSSSTSYWRISVATINLSGFEKLSHTPEVRQDSSYAIHQPVPLKII